MNRVVILVKQPRDENPFHKRLFIRPKPFERGEQITPLDSLTDQPSTGGGKARHS